MKRLFNVLVILGIIFTLSSCEPNISSVTDGKISISAHERVNEINKSVDVNCINNNEVILLYDVDDTHVYVLQYSFKEKAYVIKSLIKKERTAEAIVFFMTLGLIIAAFVIGIILFESS
jgi:hypothetical protein